MSEKNRVLSHFNEISNFIDYDIIMIGISLCSQNPDPGSFEKKYGLKAIFKSYIGGFTSKILGVIILHNANGHS